MKRVTTTTSLGTPALPRAVEQRALLDDGARREEIATKDVRRAHRGIGIPRRERMTGGRAERVRAGRADVVGLAAALGVDAHEEAKRRPVRAVDHAEALDVAREGAVVAASDAESEEATDDDLRLERSGSGEEVEDPAADLVARRLVLEHQPEGLALARVQTKERERRGAPHRGGLPADREAAEHGGDGARLGRGGMGGGGGEG